MKIHKCNQHCITGNPLLSPPPGGGAYLFQAHVRGGLIKTGGLRPRNYIKWISSSTRRLEFMQLRIKNNSKLPVGK